MAFPKAGTRRIVVDGRAYLWRVPRRPTYDQECFSDPMTMTVRAEDGPGGTLRMRLAQRRPDNINRPGPPVTPAAVAALVRSAIAAGWDPDRGRGATHMDIPKGEAR